MYYPKLDLTSIADDQGSEVLADPRRFERIQERVRERTNASVSIVQESGVVVLRGEVSNRRDSELIEAILGFEPGVDRVRNELVIRPSSGRQF
jgi:osmotically-inducible protein OsmY